MFVFRSDFQIAGLQGHGKKKFLDKKILKFQDVFQDIKPRKHAEKVTLKSSKIQ